MPIIRTKFGFPIFTIIFILYCIVNGFPDAGIWYGVGAVIVDLVINPIYSKEEIDY